MAAVPRASRDWRPLAGKEVRILLDVGKPGEGYLNAVGVILSELDPKPTIRVVRLPVNDGDDIEQWLEGLPEGWETEQCRAELERISADWPEWTGRDQPAGRAGRLGSIQGRRVAVEESNPLWLHHHLRGPNGHREIVRGGRHRCAKDKG